MAFSTPGSSEHIPSGFAAIGLMGCDRACVLQQNGYFCCLGLTAQSQDFCFFVCVTVTASALLGASVGVGSW